jgi:hypothetical protein
MEWHSKDKVGFTWTQSCNLALSTSYCLARFSSSSIPVARQSTKKPEQSYGHERFDHRSPTWVESTPALGHRIRFANDVLQ